MGGGSFWVGVSTYTPGGDATFPARRRAGSQNELSKPQPSDKRREGLQCHAPGRLNTSTGGSESSPRRRTAASLTALSATAFSTTNTHGVQILPSLITFFLSAGAVKIPLIMVA
nr:MAG TPA: hypothetical protein [Caudoviricetes sp.]